MDDNTIIELYWARDEQALAQSELKYGKLCRSVAFRILRDLQDAEECVNDTWLRAWGAMPPERPNVLSAFFSRITRNLSIDRYKASHAEKRGGGQITLALDELSDCISGKDLPEDTVQYRQLTEQIDGFLRTLKEKDRCIFLRRYWYVDSVQEIAKRYHMPEGSVKSSLSRTRQKLRAALEQEGVAV